MDARRALEIQSVLGTYTMSMITGQAVLVVGKKDGADFRCMGIVNRIERESGGGRSYIVTTTDNYKVLCKF